ncbi:MAG: signal peptidase I [Propionibacteriaceae bacterium]|nr:signal peptidase I [Propionibacteriaceae bacterium]
MSEAHDGAGHLYLPGHSTSTSRPEPEPEPVTTSPEPHFQTAAPVYETFGAQYSPELPRSDIPDDIFDSGSQPVVPDETVLVEAPAHAEEPMKKAKPKKKRTPLGAFGAAVREIAIVVIGALIASTLLRLFVIQLFEIPSGSMENLLQNNDRVAVLKLGGYSRGDVVVFSDSQEWMAAPAPDADPVHQVLWFVGLAPDESVGYLIKRVIGLPGDRVKCCDAEGRVTVNGVALDETSYLYVDPVTQEQVEPSISAFDVTVPEGRLFVLGDHRNSSADSRCHLGDPSETGPPGIVGFVPQEDVVGRAVALVYPFSRFTGISHPASFDEIPAPTETSTEILHMEVQPCVSR